MRTGKVLGFAIGGVAALVALVLVAVLLFVHPNEYRGRIEAAVKDATGRSLTLQGDIHLSVFPWIALEFGPATLGNPPGFDGAPFLQVRHAAVRARLWPLLLGRLEMGGLDLDGLDVHLARDARGRGNWESTAAGETATSTAPGATHAPAVELARLGAVRVRDARLTFENYTVEQIQFESGPFGGSGVVPVALQFTASRGVAGESATFNGKLAVSRFAGGRVRLEAVALSGVFYRVAPLPRIEWSASIPRLDLDAGSPRVDLPAFNAVFASAQVGGSLTAIKADAGWHANGMLTLEPLVVRELLPRLGLAPVRTRDPKALAQVSAKIPFVVGDEEVRFDKLDVVVDDTHVSGSVQASLAAVPAIRFALQADQLVLDRYLAPEEAPVVTPPAKSAPPSRPLAGRDVEGTLKVAALSLAPLDLHDLTVKVAIHDGVARFHPLEAAVAGGRYTGDIGYDQRGAVPVLSLDEHLADADVGALPQLKSKRVRLSGRAAVNLKATARGEGVDDFMKTLTGRADLRLANGAIEGVDLGFELARADALLKRTAPPTPSGARRTAFDVFKVSAEIANGIAITRDLTVAASGLKVSGAGSANLPAKTLDLDVLVATPSLGGVAGLEVPMKVSGPFADPSIRPNIEALAKSRLKDKLKDVLKDKLKDLFGKP